MAPGLLDTDGTCLSKSGENILAHELAGLTGKGLTRSEGGRALNKDKLARDVFPCGFFFFFLVEFLILFFFSFIIYA